MIKQIKNQFLQDLIYKIFAKTKALRYINDKDRPKGFKRSPIIFDARKYLWTWGDPTKWDKYAGNNKFIGINFTPLGWKEKEYSSPRFEWQPNISLKIFKWCFRLVFTWNYKDDHLLADDIYYEALLDVEVYKHTLLYAYRNNQWDGAHGRKTLLTYDMLENNVALE